MRDSMTGNSPAGASEAPQLRSPAGPELSLVAPVAQFEMPEELVEAFATGNIVICAGPGISTESGTVGPMTFAEELAGQIGLDPGVRSAPAIMSAYCKRHGRQALLRAIRERFDYIRTFTELHEEATWFHHELATIHPVNHIFTTHWDTYFEDVCGAMAIVSPEDYAFAYEPTRKVFKLHGSVTNWGSIIATETDYRRLDRRLRSGAISDALKEVIASRRLVFIGFGPGDADFDVLYSFVNEQLAGAPRRAYILSMDERIDRTTHPDAVLLRTTPDEFLRLLKDRFISEGYMLDDERYVQVALKARELTTARKQLAEVSMHENPEVIYAHSYQDGLLHAFQRILARFKTGEFSDPLAVESLIAAYDQIRTTKARQRGYWDVAYINGYTNALAWVIGDDDAREGVPMYFIFGAEALFTFAHYQSAATRAENLHPTAYAVARHLARRYQSDARPLHHTPWLS